MHNAYDQNVVTTSRQRTLTRVDACQRNATRHIRCERSLSRSHGTILTGTPAIFNFNFNFDFIIFKIYKSIT